MPDHDSVGVGDALEIRLTVPADEEGRVTGGVSLDTSDDPKYEPTSPQPPSIKTDIREHAGGKGFGIFVSAQPAPLTINNMTWHPSAAAADEVVVWFHKNFGWEWAPPVYETEEIPVIDPNTGEQRFWIDEDDGEKHLVTEIVDTDELIRPGYWTHGYSVVFDGVTFDALMTEAGR